MERNSTNENFEHFLRQNAEAFRMHPSEKVWNGISKNLHRGKRRFYFGFLTLLISSSLLGYIAFNHSPDKTTTASRTTAPSTNTGRTKDRSAINQQTVSEIAKVSTTSEAPTKVFAQPRESGERQQLSVNISPDAATGDKAELGEGQHKPLWQANLLTVFGSTGSINHIIKTPEKPAIDASNPPLEEKAQTETAQLPKKQKKNSRFSTMFFFAPTISYRKLSENKTYLRSSPVGAPYSYAALYDVNSVVTHKPDIGLEFGVTSKYDLTRNIKVRAGLQFNVNRYDIKAFKYVPEVATIALNNRYRPDSLNTLSNYRNFNGGKTDWLQNLYFQLSAPIGLEVRIKGDDKMYFGAASTIQPTYVIGDRAYLITADYKNYAQVPWLIRRWNVNTNLETFVAYSTRKVKWQVGPQVRYQLLSSFASEYPVKENLFDFGLKVGVSFNQQR
ncbi:MAG TPA: hypothetical protein VEZ55_09265 [Chitinophagaceae bacterium]|nr:hypothetical protein [Chitinophagaceae bacterium]